MNKDDVVIDQFGTYYKVTGFLGKGSQASVYKVICPNNGKQYAMKVYADGNNGVRTNIEKLIKLKHLKDESGHILDTAVFPISILEGDNDSFGYIMPLVDLSSYVPLPNLFRDSYPSVPVLIKIMRNLAVFFDRLHDLPGGYCYKDLSETNIHINPKTGDIKIIDCDNIGPPRNNTVIGTPMYIAPEIIEENCSHDQYTDDFSLAVFCYRLLIGGYPYDGPNVDQRCMQLNILNSWDAKQEFFGRKAKFCCDNNSNNLAASSDPLYKNQYKAWTSLPDELQDLMRKAFSVPIPLDRKNRPSAKNWIKVIDNVAANLYTCPYCGKTTWRKDGICFSCFKKLVNAAPAKRADVTTAGVSCHSVTLNVISPGKPLKIRNYRVGDTGKGKDISEYYSDNDTVFKIMYNTRHHVLGMYNLSGRQWKYKNGDGQIHTLDDKQICRIEEGMKFLLIPNKLQINVRTVS